MYNFDGGEDDRHIVVDCPKCSTTIWSGARCPTCAKKNVMQGEVAKPGPWVEPKKKPLRGGLK